MENLGAMAYSRYTGFRKITDRDVLELHCNHKVFRVESTYYFGSNGPFSTLINGFRSITFEKISILDSYFINKHIIIKYRSSSI